MLVERDLQLAVGRFADPFWLDHLPHDGPHCSDPAANPAADPTADAPAYKAPLQRRPSSAAVDCDRPHDHCS